MTSKILLVVQPSLSHYREPFVRALLSSKDIDFSIAGRFPKGKPGSINNNSVNTASEELRSTSSRLERKHLLGRFFWDRGLIGLIIRQKYDLVILEGNFYNISTWLATVFLRLVGRKVAYWGHGWKRPDSGLKLRLRRFFYSMPQGHFVYGNAAADYAASTGLDRKKWNVVFNSLYTLSQLKSVPIEKPILPDKLSLIFSGRLTERHRVDLLVRAVNRLNFEENLNIELCIVGDGTERDALANLAGEGNQSISFLGAQHDFEVLKEVYARSHFAVSPGASGLNVIQSLGFGVPVIVAEGDPQSGPEIEAVRDGETGLLFDHADVESLMAKVRAANEMSISKREAMSMKGHRLVVCHYSAESHSTAMLEGIRNVLKSQR